MENYTSNEASALRFRSVKKYKWWRIVIAAKRKKVKIKKEEKIQQASATIISHSRRPGVKPRDIGRVSGALRNFLAGRLAMTAIFPIRCIQRRCARKIRAHTGLYRGSRSNKLTREHLHSPWPGPLVPFLTTFHRLVSTRELSSLLLSTS